MHGCFREKVGDVVFSYLLPFLSRGSRVGYFDAEGTMLGLVMNVNNKSNTGIRA